MTELDDGVVSFTAMENGTDADYALLDGYERQHATGLAHRLIETLERLTDSLGGYQITRLEHSLQSATRARRAGADVDWVVAALLHDIGDELAPYNHSDFAASVLQPYVRDEVHWVVQHHGVFQQYYFAHHLGGNRNERERFSAHPWAALCEQFCAEWDQNSFDPDYRTDDLASFADEVQEVFAREAWAPEVVATGNGRLVA
ncbi:MAG: HD domain-containing protein [Ilumatobacteraceae bacterium]